MPKVKKERDTNIEGSQVTEIVCSPYFNAIKTLNKPQSQKKKSDLVNIHSLSSQLPLLPANRKTFEFFNQECTTLAKSLLGQLIVHIVNRQRLSGIIVEVECYLGNQDVASHSYKGKRTPRNEPMFMKSGTAYVYSIYGMYYCFNISSKDDGSCVLIRALEPVEGMEKIHCYRHERRQASSKMLKLNQLCNGPSKLCQALKIQKIYNWLPNTRWIQCTWDGVKDIVNRVQEQGIKPKFPITRRASPVFSQLMGGYVVGFILNYERGWMEAHQYQDNCNKLDLSNSQEFWMEDGVTVNPNSVIVSKRIGIDSAGEEWANKLLRFYILDNPHVSVRDRLAETILKDKG